MGARDGFETYAEGWRTGWTLPPRLSVSDWADQYRRLSKKSAAESGQWRTDRTPYLREIMDCLSAHDPTRRVVFMKGAQIGGTEAGNNWLGYVVHLVPGPMMVVQSTVDTAERWSKQRIASMIEEMPVLRERIAPARSRDSGNTTLLKEFPGGVLVIAGANSAAGLRSMPVKNLFLDEVDSYPIDLDGEGDPITLAERRTATFAKSKIFIVSTPTIKDASRIEREYESSDQRRYHVPCPDCGGRQWLKWANLCLDTAAYACEHCGALIEERHKTRMLEQGEWIKGNPQSKVAGFHISSLYSPLGLGDPWPALVEKYLEAKRDPARMKAFTNTVLGETWSEQTIKLSVDTLRGRAESYRLRYAPRGVLMITAGVDVQDNRFAVQVCGWGRGEEFWALDWIELPCDPSRAESWDMLEEYLNTPIENAFGVSMRIEMAAIDTGGHFHHEVVHHCRVAQNRGRMAIKGLSTPHNPVLRTRPSKIEYNYRGKPVRGGGEIWGIGTDTAKSAVYTRLWGDGESEDGHIRMHFSSDLPDEYFHQLTAEHYDTAKRRWLNPGKKRNEAIDTVVYGYAAAHHPRLRLNVMAESGWRLREDAFWPAQMAIVDEPKGGDPVSAAPPIAAEVPVSNPAPAGFVVSAGQNWQPRGAGYKPRSR